MTSPQTPPNQEPVDPWQPGDLILGIDPGLKGAMAFYSPRHRAVTDLFDLPVASFKKKPQIDVYAFSNLITPVKDQIKLAVIEEVGAMPGQGVVSMFRFGEACGLLRGVIAAHGAAIMLVRPGVWKTVMGLTREKDLSRKRATEMFPDLAGQFARKKDDGRAEAALLAVYGHYFGIH